MDEQDIDHHDAAVAFALEHDIDYTKLAVKIMQTNPYEFLRLVKPDLDKFATDLLTENPQFFLAAAQQIVTGMKRVSDICRFLGAGNLIDAIKAYREDTGSGLKEAKDVILAARDELVRVGRIAPPASQPSFAANAITLPLQNLSSELQGHVMVIVKSYPV